MKHPFKKIGKKVAVVETIDYAKTLELAGLLQPYGRILYASMETFLTQLLYFRILK